MNRLNLWIKTPLQRLATCAIALVIAGSANAQERDFEIIASNLANPRSVAIQPETGDVFVAESGAMRVVRIVQGKPEVVVTGFSKDYTGKSPIYDIGPLGLLFLDRDTLLVGGGGRDEGSDQLFVIDVPKPGADPVDVAKTNDKNLRLSSDAQHEPNGNFWGLARLEDNVLITTGDDARQGWVARSVLRDGKPEELRRFFSTVRASDVRGPHGIAISPDGDIAVSQSGSTSDSNDSLLLFFGAEGDFLDNFETGLRDVYGLAYGPNRGRLFAVDFNVSTPNEGGLYKLVGTREGCRAVLFARLPRPSSLAFTDNGDLYVTTVGRYVEGTQTSNGQLLRFTGLDEPKVQQ